ncbi:hypothetical protein ACRRTK_001113 [Alexandromys fortis]
MGYLTEYVDYCMQENYGMCNTVPQHVKTDKESRQCNELGKMLHDPSTCALYRTSETTENSNNYRCSNHRDASDLSNPDRHDSVHTGEEPCKSRDCLSDHPDLVTYGAEQKTLENGEGGDSV